MAHLIERCLPLARITVADDRSPQGWGHPTHAMLCSAVTFSQDQSLHLRGPVLRISPANVAPYRGVLSVMSRAIVVSEAPAVSHRVVWFAPDRPVEGNTIYRRPITQPTDVDDRETDAEHVS